LNAFKTDRATCALLLVDGAGNVVAAYPVVAFGKPVWYVTEVPGLGHEAAATLEELAALFNRLLDRLVQQQQMTTEPADFKKNLTRYRAVS
jgi:hypothetical protein